MSDISGPIVGAQTILSMMLDSECDPQNPYEINLHCQELRFKWERVTPGHQDGDKWIHGVYIFTDLEVNTKFVLGYH